MYSMKKTIIYGSDEIDDAGRENRQSASARPAEELGDDAVREKIAAMTEDEIGD